jgi:hypothetical protein
MQQQHPYQGIMNPNPTINFYCTQQMPHAAMGCPHGGDNSVVRASFIPHALNGGECRGHNHIVSSQLLFAFLIGHFLIAPYCISFRMPWQEYFLIRIIHNIHTTTM